MTRRFASKKWSARFGPWFEGKIDQEGKKVGIDRARKPRHPGFHRKEKKNGASGFRSIPSRTELTEPLETGPIRIFLDDERDAPEGFVVARTLPAFRKLLDSIDMSRLHTICLDWHLGSHAEPGQSGFDAAQMIIDKLAEYPLQFSGLSSIWLHSSDIEKAADMARMLSKPFELAEEDGILHHVYVVVGKYSASTGI